MDFHPSRIPIERVFDVADETSAAKAADEMVRMGFEDKKSGFKVLMPKERRTAKRIGYTVVTGVNYGLKKAGQDAHIRYWTYHEDDKHYAIVLAGADALNGLF